MNMTRNNIYFRILNTLFNEYLHVESLGPNKGMKIIINIKFILN